MQTRRLILVSVIGFILFLILKNPRSTNPPVSPLSKNEHKATIDPKSLFKIPSAEKGSPPNPNYKRRSSKDFEPLPPLPTGMEINLKDLRSMMSEGGNAALGIVTKEAKISAGQTECQLAPGSKLELLAKLGKTHYLAHINPPCSSASNKFWFGYFPVDSTRIIQTGPK